MFELGPFVLTAPIARGGMGEVWGGHHARTGERVAVKVVREELARVPGHVAAFRNEVRAMARLDHPCILRVLDYGTIDESTATEADGLLRAGSPYFVMEHAGGGSLQRLQRRLAWPDARRLLLSLLDALAHAHARGVVHRDLKAGNVLVATSDDARPGIKLCDFGIAHAFADQVHRHDQAEDAAGTLNYMSREQLTGAWRDYGPWTDLFALGALAWRLLTGAPPFVGTAREHMVEAHVVGPLAHLPDDSLAPPGLEAWLRRLLRAEPRHRFTRAADAAWSLLALGEPTDDGSPGDLPVVAPVAFDPHEITETVLGPLNEATDPNDGHTVDLDGPAPRVPPIPLDWRRLRTAPIPLTLHDAGLGLFPLRDVALVGRERERDRLWSHLVTAFQSRKAHFTVLTGPHGTGKTHLAHWLGARAHELGAATALHHQPDEDLVALLRRHLRLTGLTEQALDLQLRRIFRHVEPDPHRRMLDLLAGHLVDRSERFAAVHEVLVKLVEQSCGLGRQGPGRTLVLTLEAHDDPEVLAFARWLLDRQHHAPLPALVVVLATAAQRPASGPLARLVAGGADALHLGPLLPTERLELVHGLLRLERSLAALVDEASDGNPELTVGRVESLVQSEALAAGPDGFTLAPGAQPRLPDALQELWSSRVDELLSGLDPRAVMELERAAILGREVDESLWHLVCEAPERAGGGRVSMDPAGLVRRAEVAERLLRSHLATETSRGLRFAHGGIRAALIQRAQEAGRAEAHHRACHLALSQRPGTDPARLGDHLRHSGRPDEAFEALLKAAWRHLDRTAWRRALGLLAEARSALVDAGAPPDDPRWVELLVALSDGTRGEGHPDDSWRHALRAVELARAIDSPHLPDALFHAAQAAAASGRSERVLGLLDALEPLAEAQGPRAHGRALFARGTHLLRHGDPRLGVAMLTHARRLFARCDDPMGQANVDRVLGQLALQHDELPRAELLLKSAAATYEALSMRSTLAKTWAAMADVLRRQRRLDDADRLLGRLARLEQQVGTGIGAVLLHLNQGLVRVERNDWLGARRAFERATRLADLLQHEAFLGAAWGSVLAPMAALEDWAAFDGALERAESALGHTGFADRDLHASLALAAQLCDPRRRQRVNALAAAQAQALAAERPPSPFER